MHYTKRQLLEFCFQRLLDCQRPWGEWAGVEKERYVSIGREEYKIYVDEVPKPFVFITLYGLETIAIHDEKKFENRFKIALDWVKGLLENYWFKAHKKEVVGEIPDYNQKTLKKVEDIRHTAQSLLMISKFDEINMTIVNGLNNILKSQLDAAWGNDLEGQSGHIFSTVCCVELINYLIGNKQFKSILGKCHDSLQERMIVSLNRAMQWLYDINVRNNGIWRVNDNINHNVNMTALVLFRIGPLLYRNYPEMIRLTISQILDERKDIIWASYPVSLRVVNALQIMEKNGVEIDSDLMIQFIIKLINDFENEIFQSSDYTYFANILTEFLDLKMDGINFHDYLKDEFANHRSQRFVIESLRGELERIYYRLAIIRPKFNYPSSQSYKELYRQEKSKAEIIAITLKKQFGILEIEQIQNIAIATITGGKIEQSKGQIEEYLRTYKKTKLLKKVSNIWGSTQVVSVEIFSKVIAQIIKDILCIPPR